MHSVLVQYLHLNAFKFVDVGQVFLIYFINNILNDSIFSEMKSI